MTRLTTPPEGGSEPGPLTLDALYRRYSGWLLARLRRRFDPALADDLMQETYLRMARYETTQVRHPQALLMRVAVNVGRDYFRRGPGGAQAPALFPDHDAAEIEIADPPEQVERMLLKEAILALPPLYRDVFLLSRLVGLTYDEIADHLGVSVKTVEWRMSKALAFCAARLRD